MNSYFRHPIQYDLYGIYERPKGDGYGPYFSWTGDPDTRYYYIPRDIFSRQQVFQQVLHIASNWTMNNPLERLPDIPRGGMFRGNRSG